MNGKATCAILKQIRRDIAEKNDIALTIAECRHQGDCPGTCPRCEAEVRLLEKALAEKKKRGIQTAVAGISAGLLAAGLVSCTPIGAEKPQNPGTSGGDAGTQIEETAEATVTAGELAPPEFTEVDGLLVPPENADAGDGEGIGADGTVPQSEDDPILEDEFPLEGEPPVTDYCLDGEDDEEIEFAGLLAAEEYVLEGDVPAPDREEEQP